MAHAVQKVVQRCEDCENNGGSMGKNSIFLFTFFGLIMKNCEINDDLWQNVVQQLKNKQHKFVCSCKIL